LLPSGVEPDGNFFLGRRCLRKALMAWLSEESMRPKPQSRIYNLNMPLESVRKVADADFPTRWGHFRILGFEGTVVGPEPCREGATMPSIKTEGAVALVMGDIASAPPIVRIHSQCLTGDVFHSLRCDCRQQLELALRTIAEAGSGILLYEQQEGRGIGLMAKLKAYELQDQGRDTVEANVELGFKPDCREFELPAAVLKLMGVKSVRLMTNNPEKVAALEAAGIAVVERISAEIEPEDTFREYLKVKREKMGHLSDSLTAK
jgi:GTP cyclohydrolase II